MTQEKIVRYAFPSIIIAFLLVLPIPGTIALRYVLLALLMGISIHCWGKENRVEWGRDFPSRFLVFGLLLFTFWLVVHTSIIASQPELAWREIKSQWLPPLLATFIGLTFSKILLQQGVMRQTIAGILLLGLLVQSLFSLLITTPEFISTGAYPQGKTNWTAGKLQLSYWNNIALAFVVVDLLVRHLFNQKLTFLSTLVLWFFAILLITSNLMFGARNGLIGSALLLLSLFALLTFQSRQLARQKLMSLLMLVVAGLVALTVLAYKTDARWQSFPETAQVAWELEEGGRWLNPNMPLPILSSGKAADESAYLRLSWIRAGVEWIQENPWGWGYARNAFGHAMNQRDPAFGAGGFSESGWIDLGVGVGVVGMMLWCCLSLGLMLISAKRYLNSQEPAALVLFFVVAGFNGRMLLDSVNRDHMLVVYLFVVGVLVGMLKIVHTNKRSNVGCTE